MTVRTRSGILLLGLMSLAEIAVTTNCVLSDDLKADISNDSSWTRSWNTLATGVADFLLSTEDAGANGFSEDDPVSYWSKVCNDRPQDSGSLANSIFTTGRNGTPTIQRDAILHSKKNAATAGLISLVSQPERRLSYASNAMSVYGVASLLLGPLLFFLRSRNRCGDINKVKQGDGKRLSIYIASTGGLVGLMLLFCTFLVSACAGVEHGLGLAHERKLDMRHDLMIFLENMNCRFETFLDAEIKPAIRSFKRSFSPGMNGQFSNELAIEVKRSIGNTSLQHFYQAQFLKQLGDTIRIYKNNEEMSGSLNNLIDSANKSDTQTEMLWKRISTRFDDIKKDRREAALRELSSIEKAVFVAEMSAREKINKARGSVPNNTLFPGYSGASGIAFEIASRKQTLITAACCAFVLLAIVVVVLSLTAITCAHRVTPRTFKRKTQTLRCVGWGLLGFIYSSFSLSALLVYVASKTMLLSVPCQGLICRPYFNRRPTIVDKFMPVQKNLETTKIYHIMGYMMSPPNFRKCDSSFGASLAMDNELVERVTLEHMRKILLGGSTIPVYRHEEGVLRALMNSVQDFEEFLLDENKRLRIESERQIRDSISSIKKTLALGPEVLASLVAEAVDMSYRNLVKNKVDRLEAALSALKFNIIGFVADCESLQRIYHTGFSVFCNVLVRNMNGQWVALIMIALLLNCISYTSLRISVRSLRSREGAKERSPEGIDGEVHGSHRLTSDIRAIPLCESLDAASPVQTQATDDGGDQLAGSSMLSVGSARTYSSSLQDIPEYELRN